MQSLNELNQKDSLLNSFTENPPLQNMGIIDPSSPIENINYSYLPSTKTKSPSISSFSNLPPKKDIPYIPTKNLFQPELFLEQEDIEQFICGICNKICDDPVITGCGCQTLYCKNCLNFFYINNKHICPQCNKSTGEPTILGIINTTIKNKKMKCVNFSIKCTWEGKCKDYLFHLEHECPKEIVNCPNRGCIIKLKREEISEHIEKCEFKEFSCDKCGLIMPEREKLLHKNICLKEKIKCPQGCDVEMERGDFNLHKINCEYSIIDCPYYYLGCTDKFKRKFEKEKLNEDLNKHLLLSVEKIISLENTAENCFSRIQSLETEIQNLKSAKLKDEEEIKSLLQYKAQVQNLESEIKELKKYIEQIEKEKEKEKEKHQIKISCLSYNDSVSTSKEKNNDLEIENGIKNQKEKDETNNMLIKIPKERITENSVKKLLANKRKMEYSSKSIYSNQEENVYIKLKKKSESQKEVIQKNINNQYKESIYDILPKYRDLFSINENIIESSSLTGNKHIYIFFDKKYDIPKKSDKIYKIKYKLLKDISWLGLGICDKKIVENNNYEFSPGNNQKKKENRKTTNIGTYIINTNKICWNCNNAIQCKAIDTVINKANNEIELVLNPLECKLEFKFKNSLLTKFSDVRCFKSECFSPCIIFLKNCKIETNFDYPSF